MSIHETSMGGSREAFPDTALSSLLPGPGLTPELRRERMNRLCSRYWRPVYAYIRASRGRSIEDAKDLTQEFFRYVMESELLAKYRPEEGRFRHYLKGTLKNFLLKAHRDATTLKRGGVAVLSSLDTDELETEEFLADVSQETPDRLFDRQWTESVVAEGLARLRRSLADDGKELYFRVYESQELSAGPERPSYAGTARALGIGEEDVRNHLRHVRQRLQQIVIHIVSEYSSSPDELRDEMKELFRGSTDAGAAR